MKQLSANVLGQIAVMQNMLALLPDNANMLDFVCHGLRDIPGVGRVRAQGPDGVIRPSSPGPLDHELNLEIKKQGKVYGALQFEIIDQPLFLPYKPYVENLCNMLAVVYAEINQRKENRQLMATLEKRVIERTRDLEEENIERRQAEKKLDSALRYIASIIDLMPSMLIGIDKEGRITQWNKATEKFYMLPAEEAMGRPLKKVKPLLSRELELAMKQPAHDGHSSRMSRKQIVDGKARYTETTVYPLKDYGMEEMIIRVDDVSERVALEEQYHHAQKMEAIGQLAGGIAHDFNNVIQGIFGFSEMLMMETEGHLKEYAQEILKAGQRASALVGHLLSFSRQQVSELRAVGINGVIVDIANMIDRIIGEHYSLELDCHAERDMVYADASQISQILLNLCINARDAMSEGGVIYVRTGDMEPNEGFSKEHAWAEYAPYVWIEVEDSGCGIDASLYETVFEPFFTTKEVGKGSGLGLATVYAQVHEHGGGIVVDSTVGEGTTFKVYLPVMRHAPETAPEKVKDSAKGGSETILVVENDVTVQRQATLQLQRAGYSVLTADDGQDAINSVIHHADHIDLLIMDVVMQGMNGLAAYKKIRECADLPVLFMSSCGVNGLLGQIEEQEFPLIYKPWQCDDLLRAIRDVLMERNVEA